MALGMASLGFGGPEGVGQAPPKNLLAFQLRAAVFGTTATWACH